MSGIAVTKGRAAEKLEKAWAAADSSAGQYEVPLVGIFGRGVPEGLVAAAGAVPVHVNFGKAPDQTPMQAVIEPFVDHEVRVFLNRFALGAFDGMSGLVFARDDAAALTAYQYANEWVRQGRASADAPPLFLFNLVHARREAVSRFNQIQCDKLIAFLGAIGLGKPDNEPLEMAAADAVRRAKALEVVHACAPAADATRWRQAGRFMSARDHAELLEQVVQDAENAELSGPRLALVGSPFDDPDFFAVLDRIGVLVTDLQAYGHIWPGAWETAIDPDSLRTALADDPFCPRIVPPSRHRDALLDAIVAARCDLVVCQLAQTDDSFGWEVPGLAAALAERGISFVNLGFRDPRPTPEWLAEAERGLNAALEAAA